MNRIALGLVIGLIGIGVSVLAFVALRPPPQAVTETPPTPPLAETPPVVNPVVPDATPAAPPIAAAVPALVVDDPDFISHLLQAPRRAAAAITPDGWQVVVAVDEYRDFNKCEFSGLVWRDLQTGTEVKRLDLRKHLDPASVDRKPGLFGEEAHLKYHQLLFAPNGKLIVSGGISWPDPVKIQRYLERPELRVSSTIFIGGNCYSASGFLWVVDPDTGKVEKTLIRDRVDFVSDIEFSRDGTKLLVQMTLPPRTRNRSDDPPFVEVQQWDVAKWERDWVKVVEPGEVQKLRAGR